MYVYKMYMIPSIHVCICVQSYMYMYMCASYFGHVDTVCMMYVQVYMYTCIRGTCTVIPEIFAV